MLTREQRNELEQSRGARISMLRGWLREGKVQYTHPHSEFCDDRHTTYEHVVAVDGRVGLHVGNAYFTDAQEDYPSIELIAHLALAIAAGADRG